MTQVIVQLSWTFKPKVTFRIRLSRNCLKTVPINSFFNDTVRGNFLLNHVLLMKYDLTFFLNNYLLPKETARATTRDTSKHSTTTWFLQQQFKRKSIEWSKCDSCQLDTHPRRANTTIVHLFSNCITKSTTYGVATSVTIRSRYDGHRCRRYLRRTITVLLSVM